jgi:hypothetical protein
MSKQILALAVLEPHPGKEQACLDLLRQFYDMLLAKGYSRDILFREGKKDESSKERFVHLRIWTSNETRTEAAQDPEVHKYWMRLPEVCTITTIYESLEELYSTYESSAKVPS